MSRLRQIREERGIKQLELALLLHVTPPTYSKKENGSIRFSLEEAKTIADYLQVSIEDIFF